MKKNSLLILLMFVFFQAVCLAEGNSFTPLKKKDDIHASNRPRVPDGQMISCTYFDGNICLDFVYPEGQCDLYIMEEKAGYVQHFSFDSSELSVLVEVDLAGKTHISLVTEYGNTYQGVILDDGSEQE